jgi:ADP-ribose pyrophosphatase YjhB (NUDIX family)
MAIKAYFNITNVRAFIELCKSDRIYLKSPFSSDATKHSPDIDEFERMIEAYHLLPIFGYAKDLEGTGLHHAERTTVPAAAIVDMCTSFNQIRCNYLPGVRVGMDAVQPLPFLQRKGEVGIPLFLSKEVACIKKPDEALALEWQAHPMDPMHLENSAFLEVPFGSGPSGLARFGVVLLTPEILQTGHVVHQDESLLSPPSNKPFGQHSPFEDATSTPKASEAVETTTTIVNTQSEVKKVDSEPVKYENPVHVGLAMIPVYAPHTLSPVQWLCVSRGIPPGTGKIAFPGGFQDKGERMIQTVIRELKEELGEQVFEMLKAFANIDEEARWEFVGDRITPSNQCLDFYQYKGHLTIAQAKYICKVFQPNAEVQALCVQEASCPTTPWAFPLHREMARTRIASLK